MISNSAWVASRRVARVYMVQAAYCIAIRDLGIEEIDIVKDIFDSYNQELGDCDQELFYTLLCSFLTNYKKNDQLIQSKLIEGWRFERFDLTTLSIIRTAVCEIISCTENPEKLVINEYVTMAQHFISSEQVNFVNAILDRLRREKAFL